MVAYISIAIAVAIIMVVVGFSLGNKSKGNQQDSAELINNLHSQVAELNEKVKAHETTISNQAEQIKTLTSERDVQKAHADNFNSMLATQKDSYEKLLNSQKEDADNAINTERNRNAKREEELKATFDKQTADFKASYEKQIEEIKQEAKSHLQKQEADAEEYRRTETQRNAEAIANMKQAYETQIAELKDSHDKQLAQAKDGAEKQIEALKLMNKEQVDSQLKLIKEQMQTTSEEILKRRQEELGERNKEQVSKIIDPLQQCIKDMQEAFDKTKEQQSEALTRLDETIKINMQKSAALGETADRLTRALTGEVKVQGNFGELKLKQLLEDLELKEGEQFDTQETLRDKTGKTAKGDDGRGLIPDFILHFPNNRHVVVDSKMSLTDYERYMNAEDGTPEDRISEIAHHQHESPSKATGKEGIYEVSAKRIQQAQLCHHVCSYRGSTQSCPAQRQHSLARGIRPGRDDSGSTNDVHESPRAGNDVDTSTAAEKPAGHDGCGKHHNRPRTRLRHTFHGRRVKHERHYQEDFQTEDYDSRQWCKHHHGSQEAS